jgi:tRNA threonylcarbamoyladenosine biosynthesis protein TsaE
MICKTYSFEQTYLLGKKFGLNIAGCKDGGRFIFALNGGLGCGKTAFVSGLARGLGIDDPVLSPSFTIVKEYSSGVYPLFHIDLYRLFDISDLMSFDFYEYAGSEKFVMAIEWADKFGDMGYLPDAPAVIGSISQNIELDENLRIFKFIFVNIGEKLKKEIATI